MCFMPTWKHLLCCERKFDMRSLGMEVPLEVELPLPPTTHIWAIFHAETADCGFASDTSLVRDNATF